MRIAVDKTVLQAQPSFRTGMAQDGSTTIEIVSDGVRVIVLLEPAEATAHGVGLIQCGGLASLRKQHMPQEQRENGAASPIVRP